MRVIIKLSRVWGCEQATIGRCLTEAESNMRERRVKLSGTKYKAVVYKPFQPVDNNVFKLPQPSSFACRLLLENISNTVSSVWYHSEKNQISEGQSDIMVGESEVQHASFFKFWKIKSSRQENTFNCFTGEAEGETFLIRFSSSLFRSTSRLVENHRLLYISVPSSSMLCQRC